MNHESSKDFQLRDFRQLAKSYVYSDQYVVAREVQGWTLRLAPVRWLRCVAYGAVFCSVFSGAIYLCRMSNPRSFSLFEVAIVAFVTLMPFFFPVARAIQFRKRQPLVTIAHDLREIRLNAETEVIPIDHLIAFCDLTHVDDEGDRHAELQIIIAAEGSYDYRLVAQMLGGVDGGIRQAAVALARLVQCRHLSVDLTEGTIVEHNDIQEVYM